ncbi:hypothetical protein PMAYCL1PPCAC_01679, partial [Pristionchus mayeri]
VGCLEVCLAPFRRTRAARFFRKHKDYIEAAGTLDAVYFVSCMGDRLWAFSIGFFIADLGGLTWVAIGQLFDSLVKAVALPQVGKVLDRVERHLGMQIILLCNNIFIACSAISFYFSLGKYFDEGITHVLLLAALLLNGLSRVASEAQRAAFMKDWIIVIVDESKVGKLSTHNTVCTAIDQLAAFFSPILAGYAMMGIGKANTALCFMAWNVVSWALESMIVRRLFIRTPALHVRGEKEHEATPDDSCANSTGSLMVYIRQKCFRPAFALALLFMTVLGFDNIAIAYGNDQGLSPETLGNFRSAGALIGFIGVWCYKLLDVRKVHVVAIGAIGLVLQNVFLSLTTVSVFLPGNDFDLGGYLENKTIAGWVDDAYGAIVSGKKETTDGQEKSFEWMWHNSTSLLFFFLGITFARFGLWMADPAIQEIMQETIPEKERYRVNLTQNSIQEFFSVLKDILVIMFPLAATFGCLVLMSTTFVFAGMLLYLSYFVTEGFPCKREKVRPEEEEMVPKLEFNVIEDGVHPELIELLEKGDVEKEAPLQTNRTDAL